MHRYDEKKIDADLYWGLGLTGINFYWLHSSIIPAKIETDFQN